MFWHNFKYSLKTLLRNKILLFWTFAFPIILGLFFHMAFSDIEKNEQLDIINIAVVEEETTEQNQFIKESLAYLGDEKNENRLFQITYSTEKEAKQLLEEKKITGYLNLQKEDVKITVSTTGVNETIFKSAIDEMRSYQEMIIQIATYKIEDSQDYSINYEKFYEDIAKEIQESAGTINDQSSKSLSYTMVEYYTLIAMACLYGGTLSMFITNKKLANMNEVGKRTTISAIYSGKLLLGSLLASYIVQLFGLAILFLFTIFILKVDYGANLPYMIMLACCGSLAGLTLGVAVATLTKANENAKTGILIAITMFGCFLSGMMGITMKYIVDKNIPILNKINPAGMITDGFYALYHYDTMNRFLGNIMSLLIFSIVMIAISYRGLRRKRYDSI